MDGRRKADLAIVDRMVRELLQTSQVASLTKISRSQSRDITLPVTALKAIVMSGEDLDLDEGRLEAKVEPTIYSCVDCVLILFYLYRQSYVLIQKSL